MDSLSKGILKGLSGLSGASGNPYMVNNAGVFGHIHGAEQIPKFPGESTADYWKRRGMNPMIVPKSMPAGAILVTAAPTSQSTTIDIKTQESRPIPPAETNTAPTELVQPPTKSTPTTTTPSTTDTTQKPTTETPGINAPPTPKVQEMPLYQKVGIGVGIIAAIAGAIYYSRRKKR